MKVLFALGSPDYLRFYDDTIRLLAARGHTVSIAVSRANEGKPVRLEALERMGPGVGVAGFVPPRADRWAVLARAVRGTMDFVRYLHPDFATALLLRARAKRQALPSGLQWLDLIPRLPPRAVSGVMRGLAGVERAIPPSAELVEFVGAQAPDLVLVSPLVELVSDQVDLVRACQARGTRVATLVASWDNLTNKGDLRVATDLVVVWNEAQRREAVEYHRVPTEQVVVTGAQPFDRWFGRTPSRPRAVFCREAGLPDDRPFVLFTGSSIFIARAGPEMAFVRRWIQALRASAHPQVRDLGVLVRPHPYNGRAWEPDAFADMAGVTVWPRGGYDPTDVAHRNGLFDSLYHCAVVVGINTSAMIEAAIVGRPVLSIAPDEFAGSQAGTLHFRHLLPEHGGFLRVASDFDEHLRQLAAVLRDPEAISRELSRFVETFVRPHGAAQASTPILVDAIERFGRSAAPAPMRRLPAGALLGAALRPLSRLRLLMASPADRKLHVRGAPVGRERRAEKVPSAPLLARSMTWAMRAALVGPAVCGTLLLALFAVSEMLGQAPLSYEAPRNIAEAAGMAMESEVLRFMRQGQDPTAVFPVRPDIISSSVTRVTALEAAIWSRRVRLIGMLEREGAIRDEDTRRHLVCLAADIRADELARRLAPEGPHGCQAGHASKSVQARSQ